MATEYHDLLNGNKKFVEDKLKIDPDYFRHLSKGQSPEYLWIGCSDSRVPAEDITRMQPGDVFVHRNIANLVINTDINLLSVIHYAVKYLKVKHIIVCGHYECGGVNAAMSNTKFGMIDNWLSHIKDVYRNHSIELEGINNPIERSKKLVEYNVMDQVINLGKVSVIQEAWQEGQYPILHGWVFDMGTGFIKDLDVKIGEIEDLHNIYKFDL